MLSEFVANQIAAGEVVNRPSSAVKEMMENAIDAGARNVTVCFRDGGRAMIRVVDDGCGMSPVDARLAFDRHATSKIASVEDIYRLGTFGFRGEALASIASVAEVQLRTRREGDELGTQTEIHGSRFIGTQPVSCPAGSQFTVCNLFYNVPARRRFLDKSSTEARHITAEYQRVALCNPDVGFALYDGDALLSRVAPATLKQRVIDIVGKSVARNLLDVDADTSIVRVEGFVGRPATARQTNKEQFLFVNGRYFKSPYFHKAVMSAFAKLVAPNTQPSYFLYLTVASDHIDVNVHPQKTEVKFENGAEIWQIINAAVRESLARAGVTPAMDFDVDASVEIPALKQNSAANVTYKMPSIKANPDFNPFEKYTDDHRPARVASPDFSAVNSTVSDDFEISALEFIDGEDAPQTLFESGVTTCDPNMALPLGVRYAAVAIGGNALTLIDLPRAFEAVLYDRYTGMLAHGSAVSQQLLFPERLMLSLDDAGLLAAHTADFAAFGFDIVLRDQHTAEITGLPADLATCNVEELVYDLLDTLRDEGDRTASDIRRHRLAANMARRAAHSRNRTMTREEIAALIDALNATADPSFTPAGNPIMTTIAEEEIGKLIGK